MIKPPFLVWMQKLRQKNFENKGDTTRITHGLIYEFNLSKDIDFLAQHMKENSVELRF